jgi:hypothetical protein
MLSGYSIQGRYLCAAWSFRRSGLRAGRRVLQEDPDMAMLLKKMTMESMAFPRWPRRWPDWAE